MLRSKREEQKKDVYKRQDIVIIKSEFVAKTQFLSLKD